MKKYEGSLIYVIDVTKDVDTGKSIVIFHHGYDVSRPFVMTKKSFCEMVEVDGAYADKFTRLTQMKIAGNHILNLEELGFECSVRRKVKDETIEVFATRDLRSATNYVSYAKDLCRNFRMDTRRLKLCIKQKRYIGVENKEEFVILKEDVKFLDDCLKTVLRKHESIFRAMYIEEKSIRKYADELGVNRGSIDYRNQKLIADLAGALKARDESDGVCRIKK